MTRAIFHTDIEHFTGLAQPFLLQREAEDNVMLGLLSAIAGGRYPDYWLTSLEDAGQVVGCALQTPPFHMLLTRMPPEALAALADALLARRPELEGVNGATEVSTAFSALWQSRTTATASVEMEQGIYSLEEVVPPRSIAPGSMRVIREEDASFVEGWIDGFFEDTGVVRSETTGAMFKRRLGTQSLFVWQDGDLPVSMAGWGGPTPNGVRVSAVYTPPDLRGRGYASALVARLSQHLLDEGHRFCFLYTDLSNPTSNKLYQQLGYRHVCDATMIRFDY